MSFVTLSSATMLPLHKELFSLPVKTIITWGRKAPESRFRLFFFIIISCVLNLLRSCKAQTRIEPGYTKVKMCCTIDSRWRSSAVGRY